MNTNKIERAAVRVVEEYIDKCPKLEPYITSNDKTPIWDGDIYIFNDEESHIVNEFRNRVPLQIKGTENGKEDSFRMDENTLKDSRPIEDVCSSFVKLGKNHMGFFMLFFL